ncbi:hypothetical protein IL54_3623 [Sphingobium sp. ba1]|nr:hypothetical protein IL54_3623 [Sphingobium sp. ba1]
MGGDGARRFAGSLPWCIPIGSVARVVADGCVIGAS